MCGGNKGTTTSNTNQTQTYAPNAQAAGYIGNALGRASDTANSPFNIPQAPIAGFSQDQQGAFQQFRDAQGAAQPYYNQAANIYGQTAQGPDISQFFNPYAGAVGASMQDLFGQQRSQNTGDLVKAAGGVGADRIGVGQSELAKQQDLAYGQTMAGLYAPALQAGLQQQGMAQNAASGLVNVGNASQGSALQGANALLGTGGLQQQLSQAQMNSPYQQQLAQAAFPYQQAQFLAGITGSLAPGLGGTTTGQGTSTTQAPPPSIWSQLLGAGTAGLGAYKTFGGSNGKGSNTGTGDGSWYGPSSVGGAPLSARGGRVDPYAEGGGIPNADPIDISKLPMVPNVQLAPMQPHIPQLNLAPPQQPQQQGSGGPSIGDIAKIAMMFASEGGRVGHPYEPMADGGAPDAYRMPDQPDGVDPIESWRGGVDADMGRGATATDGAPTAGGALAFAGADAPPSEAAGAINAYAPAARAGPRPAAGAADATQGVSPYSRPAAANPDAIPTRDSGASSSPWAALMAAGLGMMGGTSPYAGVNIGQGGMQGVKMLEAQRAASQRDETTDMAARRLAQEAQHHGDSFDIQKQQLAISKANSEKERYSAFGTIQTKDGLHPAVLETTSGKVLDAVTGKPPEKTDTVLPKGGSRNSPEEIGHVVDGIIDGSQPPTLTGLYGDSVHVRSGLQAKGFNLAKAQQEWESQKKLTSSVNSQRMVQYVGLNKSVDRTIDEVKELADQLQQGGVPLLNKLQLMGYIKTQGNSEKGQLATKYMTAVNTLKEEFANLANGGYAPTEAAWKLANEQVNGDFGMKQMHASLSEIQRLIRYRLQAVPGLATSGPGAPNRYSGQGAPPAAVPAAAAPTGGQRPDVNTRFNQLIGGGKTEQETYAILAEEGYR